MNIGDYIMGKRVRLTPSLIEEVWVLYNRDYDELKICNKLGISRASVARCLFAMKQASQGCFVEYTGLLRDSHHIADYANNKFNLSKSQPDFSEEKPKSDLLEVLQTFTQTLNRWNILFEKLINKLEK